MLQQQSTTSEAEAARVYDLWDRHLRGGDMERMAALYAEDCSMQRPLVPIYYGAGRSKLHGKADVLAFLAESVMRRPNEKAHWHRDGFLWNGRTLIWEYPNETPYGSQLDLAEVMDLEHGLIVRHRIYWGWYTIEGVKDTLTKQTRERVDQSVSGLQVRQA